VQYDLLNSRNLLLRSYKMEKTNLSRSRYIFIRTQTRFGFVFCSLN